MHFVCLSPSPERDVPTYNTGFGTTYSRTQGKWKYPLSMLRARKLIRKIQPDIVHAHYATSGGLTALICGFHPSVITVHGSDLINGIKSNLWRPILKRIFNFADCVNVVSKELSELALSLGINSDKIKVITPGVDTQKFAFVEKSQIQKDQKIKLICTRRLESVFDHFTILKALSILKEKKIDFQMTFAGDGSLLNEMKDSVNSLRMDNNVSFLGKVSHDDLPAILAEHDIYLSASLWDGTSLSLLEAMSVGLFPIVSDIKSNSTWIQNESNGLLHKVSSAEDLANCIMKLLDKPEIIQKAFIENRQKVIEEADRKTNMELLESVYKNLINK